MFARNDLSRPGGTARDARVPVLAAAAVFLASYLTWRLMPDILLTISDVLVMLSLAVVVMERRAAATPFGALTPLWFAAFGMLAGGLLIGSVAGQDPLRWLIVAGQYAFAWLVLPVVLNSFNSRALITLGKALVAGVTIMEAIGIGVYFGYAGSFWDARNFWGVSFLTGTHRLGAFTADANWNGAAIAMAFPMLWYLMFKGAVGRGLGVLACMILAVGLALTASFTAFSSAAIAFAIFAPVAGLRPSPKMIVAGLLLALAVVEMDVQLPETFKARVGRALESGDITEAGTFVGRAELIRDAWQLSEAHILVGVGADQYRVVSTLKAPVHNTYLLLLVEGGHVRKQEATDIFDTISGTMGLTGVVDTMLIVGRVGDTTQLAGQGRDLEPFERVVTRDKLTGGWVIGGDAGEAASTSERQMILDVLQVEPAPMTPTEIASAIGKKQTNVSHQLRGLLREGKVEKTGKGRWAITTFTPFTDTGQRE